MKLIQKNFPKGSREFEIIDDTVHVRIKKLLKEERLTIDLSRLDPVPVENGSELIFHSTGKHGLSLSLFRDKPNASAFNAFVAVLKQSISGEDSSQTSAPGWNVYEEPPGFEDEEASQKTIAFKPVNAQRVAGDITMLSTYLDKEAIKPLIDALEILKAEPENEAAFQHVVNTYQELGINQGAALTYAPYLKVLLSQVFW